VIDRTSSLYVGAVGIVTLLLLWFYVSRSSGDR